jgi:penicillin-binding protein 2
MMELYLKGEIAPEDKVLEEQISNTVVDSDRIYSLVDRGL